FFSVYLHFFHLTGVIVLVDYGEFLELTRSFNYPIFYVFMVKTAFITDELFHFVVFVFASCNSLNFVSEHPKGCFSATFIAVSVCIERFVKPNSRLKTECLVRQSSNRTHINHISRKLIVNCFGNISRNLCVDASVHHSVNSLVCKLVGYFYATVAQNTTVHMKLNFISDIFRLKSSFFFFKAGFFQSV